MLQIVKVGDGFPALLLGILLRKIRYQLGQAFDKRVKGIEIPVDGLGIGGHHLFLKLFYPCLDLVPNLFNLLLPVLIHLFGGTGQGCKGYVAKAFIEAVPGCAMCQSDKRLNLLQLILIDGDVFLKAYGRLEPLNGALHLITEPLQLQLNSIDEHPSPGGLTKILI